MKINKNKQLYNVSEVLENFKTVFGVSYTELEDLFNKYDKLIIDEKNIQAHIEGNSVHQPENRTISLANTKKGRIINLYVGKRPEVISKKRFNDYMQYYHRLVILANKGKQYLDLLNYLSSIETEGKDDFYELVLDQLMIIHYDGTILGEHLNQLIKAIISIKIEMHYLINKINKLENYNQQQTNVFTRAITSVKDYNLDKIRSKSTPNSIYPNGLKPTNPIRLKRLAKKNTPKNKIQK